MECGEEEDTNSLLSLSQTFLQTDNSSSAISLGANQLHTWPNGSAGSTAELTSHFSPVSPADGGYGPSGNAGQILVEYDSSLRFYGVRSSTNQSTSKPNVSNLFSRSDLNTNSLSIQNNFSSSHRVSASEFGHTSNHTNLDSTMCYKLSNDVRGGSELYDEKEQNFVGRGEVEADFNSQPQRDISNDVVTSLGSSSVYNAAHSIMALPTEKISKPGNRNDHLELNTPSRTKQQDYAKEIENLYETSNKTLQGTDMAMSFDRRDNTHFDSTFELSSSARDFTSAGRMDMTSANRGTQDLEYHQSQKYTSASLGESEILSGSLTLDSKRVSSSYMGFTLDTQAEEAYGRASGSQKKSLYPQHFSDLPSDLEPVFQRCQADFLGHQKPPVDTHRNFGMPEYRESEDNNRYHNSKCHTQPQSKDNSNKWSGRPRAHKKMARLLGSEGHREQLAATDSNSPQKVPVLSRNSSSTDSVSQSKSLYQQSSHRDMTTTSRAFLTMEEELDLRTNHQQRTFIPRRGEGFDRHQSTQRDLGLLQTTTAFSFDSGPVTTPLHKDAMTSILSNQQFVPSSQFDLDFHSSLSVSQQQQKDLDLNQHFGLQVSKDFSMEATHSIPSHDELPFDHSGDTQHMNQGELSLPDNLGIVPHVQQELNLEAYFNTTSDRDFSSERELAFGRKFSIPTSREMPYVPNSAVSDFNFDDYMNPQSQRELNHSYLERPDMPQDMTVYQKSPAEKTMIPEPLLPFKARDKNQTTTSSEKDRSGEISELQKELTKTSTKESMKGIRTPRDINRAMEIFQGLQEDEREEERRKEQQQKQQQKQQMQLQNQGLVSSPKKSFQNKHQVESMNIPEQQFLSSSESYMEDQSVGSFLDQHHLNITDQQTDSLQMVQSYQNFTQLPQPNEEDISSTLSGKRDLQQNLSQTVTSDLDYHILKRLALSASVKDPTVAQSSSFPTNSTNLASILSGNPNHVSDVQFPLGGMSHFPNQSSELDDVMATHILSHNNQSVADHPRSKNEMSFIDFDSRLPPQPSVSDKPSVSGVTSDSVLHSSLDATLINNTKREAEVLISSRKNLYTMMKREQFCDAVLSTSKQTLKVHQAVLCSMSQYLTTLLHKMTPSMPDGPSQIPSSPTSCFSSQGLRSHGILLVVNCEGIKLTSMSAFLVYIYLGSVDLSHSNVVDMYKLACSLRVTTLKEVCKDFLQENHISEDQIKVPQLLVSNQRLEMQDKACMTDLIGGKICDDKSTNTPNMGRNMDVATQTDRSTSEAGEGGQEEWVMLKKTKQKTVSPSKSHLIGKTFTGAESPVSFRAGKKGWLSPKRRYKTETQLEMKPVEKDSALADRDRAMHGVTSTVSQPCYQEAKESATTLQSSNLNCSAQQRNLDNPATEPQAAVELKAGQSTAVLISSSKGSLFPPSECNNNNNNNASASTKTTRTTVEIAAAAAAAKLSAHSYGTRAARGHAKSPVSYAALASGQDKKKSALQKDKTQTSYSKKKDFIQSNSNKTFGQESVSASQADSHIPFQNDQCILATDETNTFGSGSDTGKSVQVAIDQKKTVRSEQMKPGPTNVKSSVKQPFKKSIVHRSRSEEVLKSTEEVEPLSAVNIFKRDDGLEGNSLSTRADPNLSNESDFMDSNLIDSIVSTMECEHPDMDLQRVINDLDTLNKSPSLATPSTSSVSSTSLTSPLKSPTQSLSTLCQSSPVKSRSTPQGFRKRLIQLMNSEKNGSLSAAQTFTNDNQAASTNSSSTDHTPATKESSSSPVHTRMSTTTASAAPIPPVTYSVTSSASRQSDIGSTSIVTDQEHQSTFTNSSDEVTFTPNLLGTEPGLVSDNQSISFAGMTDQDLGLKEDSGQQFLHKIFKRKKKTKTRKSAVADTDGNASMKTKPYKLTATELEGSTLKPRQRKATGSDTEGGGARTKQKKSASGDLQGGLAKVRPPPKKRAKMELELLKAADSEKKDKGHDAILSSSQLGVVMDKTSQRKEWKSSKESYSLGESQQLVEAGDKKGLRNKQTDNLLQRLDNKTKKQQKPSQSCKQRSDKSSKGEKDMLHQTMEITTNTKMTLMIEELAKHMNLKSKQFTCKLCLTKVRSARRTIKHMGCHGLAGEEALENISIGEMQTEQEACDVCGYKTKDRTYHYMHYHKYFKHGVALPLGWSTDKCHICGKECFTKFQLKEHMLTHEEDHCYICWHCGQSFKVRNCLNSHLFHKHSDIRKHVCKACGKTFKTWTQLKVHVRSHTGERPFACTFCDHRSTTQGNMKLHLVTHGYTRDQAQELMEKIALNEPEMNPETLDQIMISIADKVKAEQSNAKDKKPREKIKKPRSSKDPVSDAGKKGQDVDSPTTASSDDTSAQKRRKPRQKKSETSTTVSKFAGSQIKRLLTEPLNKLKPPKFLLPQLSQSSVSTENIIAGANEGNDNVQVLSESAATDLQGLSLLLQQQQPPTNRNDGTTLPATTFFIPLSQGDQSSLLTSLPQQQDPNPQHQQQQQNQPQPTLDSLSNFMNYTIISTQMLPSQTSSEMTMDPTSALSLPVLSTNDMLSSGLTMLQSGCPPVQLIQPDGSFTNGTLSNALQSSQETVVVSDLTSFLASSQGTELLQETPSINLQCPATNILVTDMTQSGLNTDSFPGALPSNGTEDSSTIMVLPNVVRNDAPLEALQQQQQAQTIFSSPDLVSVSAAMLPVTPGLQLGTSNVNSGNNVNYSWTASESKSSELPGVNAGLEILGTSSTIIATPGDDRMLVVTAVEGNSDGNENRDSCMDEGT